MPTSRPEPSDLPTRVAVLEEELRRLRDWRHAANNEHMIATISVQKFEARIERFETTLAHIKSDIASGHTDQAKLESEMAALHHDLEILERQFHLKTSEYDKERKAVWSILKPIVIFLALGLVGGLVALLVKLYVMFGANK